MPMLTSNVVRRHRIAPHRTATPSRQPSFPSDSAVTVTRKEPETAV